MSIFLTAIMECHKILKGNIYTNKCVKYYHLNKVNFPLYIAWETVWNIEQS